MIRLYGVPRSRASRCLWLLEELGVPYENVPIAKTREPDYLAINPNGRIPALDDDGVVMWESLAINLYLARRFPSELSPRDLAEEAHVLKWSFWAQSELEEFFNHTAALEEIPGDWYERTLRVLDRALASEPHLVGGRFTVADLNVACMFSGPVSSTLDLSGHPHAGKWLAACRARPAAQRVIRRAQEGLRQAQRR